MEPWEQGIRVRLGKNPRLLLPGFHWKIPYVDAIFRQATRRRYSNFGPQTVTTLDGVTLTISGAIGYNIRDLLDLYDRLHHAEDAIGIMAMAAVAEYVSARPFTSCTPSAIADACKESMGLRKFGLLVSSFSLTTYARARTYRLITEPPQAPGYGDALDTTKKDGP